jgi:hypothetical protein
MYSRKYFTQAEIFIVFLFILMPLLAKAQTVAFTYQGRFNDGSTPAKRQSDSEFTQVGSLSVNGLRANRCFFNFFLS